MASTATAQIVKTWQPTISAFGPPYCECYLGAANPTCRGVTPYLGPQICASRTMQILTGQDCSAYPTGQMVKTGNSEGSNYKCTATKPVGISTSDRISTPVSDCDFVCMDYDGCTCPAICTNPTAANAQTCGKIKLSASCTVDSECASGSCSNGICAPGAPKPAKSKAPMSTGAAVGVYADNSVHARPRMFWQEYYAPTRGSATGAVVYVNDVTGEAFYANEVADSVHARPRMYWQEYYRPIKSGAIGTPLQPFAAQRVPQYYWG